MTKWAGRQGLATIAGSSMNCPIEKLELKSADRAHRSWTGLGAGITQGRAVPSFLGFFGVSAAAIDAESKTP